MNLTEIYDGGKVTVIEENAKDGIMRVRFPFVVADKTNLNNRRYPLSILEREVKKINQKIAEGDSVFGFTGHPKDVYGELENVSHLIEKLSITKGIGWGLASILADSGPGKTLKMILKAGGRVGSSLRATGTVTNGVVNDDLELAGVDFVLSPSFGRAVKFDQSAIIEKQQHADSPATMKLFAEAQDAGYEGTFEDFKKLRDEKNNLDESVRQAQEYLSDEARIAGKN